MKVAKETHIHLIGIGGIGMSGLAEAFLSLGHPVSGSDLGESKQIEKLKSLGAEIFKGHKSENVENAQIVVYSSAIKKENPEYSRSQELGLPLLKRAEALGQLMAFKKGVAIAGTHGKTTTTSLLATILKESSYDPSYMIGGIVSNLGGHSYLGSGDHFIAEADESDGSFLLLDSSFSIITNIDFDHMSYYKTKENLILAFENFINKTPLDGFCAINGLDEILIELTKDKKNILTFGLDNRFDYWADEIENFSGKSKFKLCHDNESEEVFLNLPGEYNVLNFLGAAAIAHRFGISLKSIAMAITSFGEVGRRFQKLLDNGKMIVIDDYAHHPTELREAIRAAKESFSNKDLIVIFEPHRFTRTQECWDEFINSFDFVDELYLPPIFPANESPIDGVSTDQLIIELGSKVAVKKLSETRELHKILNEKSDKNCVVLTLGAGPISKITHEWIDSL